MQDCSIAGSYGKHKIPPLQEEKKDYQSIPVLRQGILARETRTFRARRCVSKVSKVSKERKTLGNYPPVLQSCTALLQGQFGSVENGLKWKCGKARPGHTYGQVFYPLQVPK